MRCRTKAFLLLCLLVPAVAHSARCINCDSETGEGQVNPVIDVHRVDAPSKRTAETCKRANSGARLALCGLGGLVVVHYSNKMAEAAKRCAASYPGPGKW